MDNGNTKPVNFDSISILVVDDDITCLAIVSAILKKFNYQVVTVKNPQDALCMLRISTNSFDLVVSDVHMPDMNGFELQQAIAREFNDLPVVLMSADDKESIALRGLECGAAFFIMKPISQDDLRDLWQFTLLKRRNNYHHNQTVVIKEIFPQEMKQKNQISIEDVADTSASSVNKDTNLKKDLKKKNPRKEGSEEKNDENSQVSSQKRPKIVWTNSLHNRFLEAIRNIGLDRAVPKKILEVMNVQGLTRENVASHLQKYRIFLRRVSDASYKIQYANHKALGLGSGLGRNLMNPSCDPSMMMSPHHQTLMLNRFGKVGVGYEIQNRGPFNPNHPIMANLEGYSSPSNYGQSSLLSNGVNWQRPSMGIHGGRIGQNNFYGSWSGSGSGSGFGYGYGPRNSSLQGHLANISLEDHLNLSNNINHYSPNNTNIEMPLPPTTRLTHPSLSQKNDVMSSLSLNNYQKTYVGYNLSNIKTFADQCGNGNGNGASTSSYRLPTTYNELDQNNGVGSGSGVVVPPPNSTRLPNMSFNSDSFVANNNNNGQEQFSNVIAASFNRPMNSGFDNGLGDLLESELSPIFDLSEFDMLSAQQALDQGCFDTTLPNQLTINQNQPLQQQQNNGGADTNIISSTFYDDIINWDNRVNNIQYSFNQTPNQLQSTQLTNSQGFGTSSDQLNETPLLPIINDDQQQTLGAAGNLNNSLAFGTLPQLNRNEVMSPTHDQRNDDDFLESLLAPWIEDQSLNGPI